MPITRFFTYLSYLLFLSTLTLSSCGKSQTNQQHIMQVQLGDDYASDWKKVAEHENKGLTESAEEVVQQIYEQAKKDRNDPQMVKALLHLWKYAAYKEENSQQKTVLDIQKEIETADEPLKSVLHSILGNMYWQYFQNNRYRILQRTEVAGNQPDDFQTWDANWLTKNITKHYLASLAADQTTKRIPIESYKAILRSEDKSINLRPTLYDFLAHRALDYFMNDQANITKASDQFTLNNKAVFALSQTFSNTKFKNTDELSVQYHALTILQNLVNFHTNDAQADALIDVELKRLRFAKNKSTLPNKEDLYVHVLKDFINKYKESGASTQFSHLLAEHYYTKGSTYEPLTQEKNQWQLKTALEICEKAIEKHPESRGTKDCKVLKQNILSKNLNFTIETAALPNQPNLTLLTYRNTNKAYWRIAILDEKVEEKVQKLSKERDSNKKIAEYYASLNPIEEWSIDLPKVGDYQTHRVETQLPELAFGKFLVLASSHPKFKIEGEAFLFQKYAVTNLSAFRKEEGSQHHFHVVHRKTGEPLPDVSYEILKEEYNYNNRKYKTKKIANGKTNGEGGFTHTVNDDRYGSNYKVILTKDQDRFEYQEYLNRYREPQVRANTNTFFFTDRSIYRPGQTIYFKGIMVEHYGEDHKLLTNKKTKVTFYDSNYQKVKQLDLTTNEYGSFSGKFTAPVGLLNGQMRIDNGSGQAYFRVEEYKRPKFEVKFDPVKGSYRLNENVQVTGKAKAYAGSNVDGASVKYRVVRRASFPYWGWGWWRPTPSSPELEIISGETTTDEQGKFKVDFTAVPDLSIDKSTKPQFNYTVYADVTDINGETRSSSTTVRVGSIALLASVNISDKLDKKDDNTFEVKTTNLNSQKEPAQVNITIHQLAQPERVFTNRKWQQPDQFMLTKAEFYEKFEHDVYKEENQADQLVKKEKVFEKSMNTAKDSVIELSNLANLPIGQYVVELTTKDKYGEKVEWKKYFTLFDMEGDDIPVNKSFWHHFNTTTAEPGDVIELAYGSALPNQKIRIEVEEDNKLVRKEWLTANEEQKLSTFKVEEKHRGGFVIYVTTVRNNEFITQKQTITVPYTNKELKIELQTFRSKIKPGAEEEWKLKISGPKGDQVAAELLAGMYDASLDAFTGHSWDFSIWRNKYFRSSVNADYGFNTSVSEKRMYNWNEQAYAQGGREYPYLNDFGFNLYGYRYRRGYNNRPNLGNVQKNGAQRTMAMSKQAARPSQVTPPPPSAPMGVAADMAQEEAESTIIDGVRNQQNKAGGAENKEEQQDNFEGVQIRKNLQETAFFFPQLQTNAAGEILLSFTAPEALTRWKLMAFGHTKDLEYKQITEETVTQKELMVLPNTPRFLRENDQITLSTKISNISDKPLNGKATLKLFDALTMESIDTKLGNTNAIQSFTTPAEQSAAVSWNLNIPVGTQAVTYQIIAKAGEFSDGEENVLPVLTNRMLVTETMPLPVRGKETKTFTFDKLAKADQSNTLQHQKLTLEFTSQPAWYAIQALPYLMEYPHQCAEQIFSRYYANSIASNVANSSPKIKKVFDTWKAEAVSASTGNTADKANAFLSNLEKNQDLKLLVLEATPWVLDAKDESERKKRVGLLFDLERMSGELAKTERELMQKQSSNGGWPWFPGLPESRYITQHIVTGMGHLDNLGVRSVRENADVWRMVKRAVGYLDVRMKEDYEQLLKYKTNLNQQNIGNTQIQYLYARSFFKDIPIDDRNQTAFDYWKEQAGEYWLENNKYMQGMIALAIHRFTDGKAKTATNIINSLRENAVRNEEMGMYFKDTGGGWYWYQAPIETQALLIEAFDEIANDRESVNDMKVWLLKQKQTQDWKTTKATAEACYALLLRGTDWLASDQLVNIKVGSQTVDPRQMPDVKVEAGTGYFKTSWQADEIKPEMATVTVSKEDEGVSWGAMYWQYFEQLDKITPAETPLSIKKELFKEENTKSGPKLIALKEGSPLKVGDKIKVRVEVRVDRLMEFVHLQDMRASGFEPINVLSTHKYQDGLYYYESTGDVATNFFMDRLPKGTYVFEYPLRVSQAGDFSNGITTMQCMYAPEFSSHSEGIRVKVK